MPKFAAQLDLQVSSSCPSTSSQSARSPAPLVVPNITLLIQDPHQNSNIPHGSPDKAKKDPIDSEEKPEMAKEEEDNKFNNLFSKTL